MLLLQDKQLLKQFREGERQAMATVFHHYADPLARYLSQGFSFASKGRQLRFDGLTQRHDVHDVVAETFRRAFETRARLAYTGLAPYESYLRRIARNIVLDQLRSSAGQWVTLEEDAPLSAATPSAEQAYQRAELAHLLSSFIDTLSPLEQRFVALRYQEQLPQEGVASRMRRTRRWVRKTELSLRQRFWDRMRTSGYLSGAVQSEGRP